MKILVLNTSDDYGGAHIASYRLYKGLRNIGLNTQMYVQNKTRIDPGVIRENTRVELFLSFIRPFLDEYPLRFYKNRPDTKMSLAWVPNAVSKKIARFSPDIVNLHWICEGFLPLSEIKKFSTPVVWTMHDMWPFTGGCHYADHCLNYEKHCGTCPQLGSGREKDLSAWVWNRKKKYWADADLTIVSPSRWIADCAKKSALFENRRIVVIPNGLDITRFKPVDKKIARSLLNLPQEKKILAFGAVSAANDKRKGFQYLLKALKHLSDFHDTSDMELIVFGSEQPENEIKTGINIKYLGTLPGELALSILYSAADVFIAPSLQENLALTIQESIACGTPVVAFNIGGNPDMIDHKKNGYLAHPFDAIDLADGISWVLSDAKQWEILSRNCRSKAVESFDLSTIASMYQKLFRSLVDKD